MANQQKESNIIVYNIRSININDHFEANCYIVVDDHLYNVYSEEFTKQELSDFKYVINSDRRLITYNKHQYNKFNKSIFMMDSNYKQIHCFNTVDHSFTLIYKALYYRYLNYGISDDGKVVYILENRNLYKIDAITKKVEFLSGPGGFKSLDYYVDAEDVEYSRMVVTNSGKLIYFSICDAEKYINIYDPNSGETVTSEKISYLGKLIYSEKDKKVIHMRKFINSYKKYSIYDTNLNKIKSDYAISHLLNFYHLDYNSYELNENDIDGSLVNSFSVSEVKDEWHHHLHSAEYDKMNDNEFMDKVDKVEDMIIISNARYRFLYRQDGKYLGRVPMQIHSLNVSELHLSKDQKHLIEMNDFCIYNYDITCLQHREQKTTMLALSREFTSNELFDRNLLPLIFEFLPKGC